MRLTTDQVSTIRKIVTAMLPRATYVGLFGSQLNDSLRGGDIDLYIEYPVAVPLMLQARLASALQEALGLSVDLIVRNIQTPPRPIENIAKVTGIPLWT
jgi:predicted nucleotidyltransferase